MEEYRLNLNKTNEFFERLEPSQIPNKNDAREISHSPYQKDKYEGK